MVPYYDLYNTYAVAFNVYSYARPSYSLIELSLFGWFSFVFFSSINTHFLFEGVEWDDRDMYPEKSLFSCCYFGIRRDDDDDNVVDVFIFFFLFFAFDSSAATRIKAGLIM